MKGVLVLFGVSFKGQQHADGLDALQSQSPLASHDRRQFEEQSTFDPALAFAALVAGSQCR
jgi:hypothetical protein